MKRILLVIGLLFPLAGNAIVDMKNSNYADQWLDLSVPGAGFDLKVQRFYNSRSNFNGMFGYGWCSDFETALTKTPEGNLKYQECGAGQEILYTLGKGDAKEVEKTIDKIIAYVKKTNRTATKQYVERLTSQLREDADLRIRWSKQAGLPAPSVKKGAVYSADSLEVEKIVWNGKHFIRTLSDGTAQRFDDDGRLAYLYDKNGNHLAFKWASSNILKEVVDNNGRKLSFSHYSNRRVKQIKGPSGLVAEYKFDGENLVFVKNMWRNAYTYKYDESHNLTRINFPDKTFKALTYDDKKDLVLSFTDRVQNGQSCTESYDYGESSKDPKNHFWSTATKKCGKEVKNTARFEFWHKTRSDGRKYLHRVLTKSNTDSLEVTYHPEFGRPTTIRRNTILTTYSYYPNGLVKEKSTANTKMTYKYEAPLNKVAKVTTEFFDDKAKLIRKRETVFDYDKKGNLVFAKNSDGQTVRLTYDTRGRIATIIDQAKKEVHIKYDERTNKPSVITRPNVGSIVVTYKDNEIKKVDSKDGPTVAVQVASTFNNLLDIIAPATSELSL